MHTEQYYSLDLYAEPRARRERPVVETRRRPRLVFRALTDEQEAKSPDSETIVRRQSDLEFDNWLAGLRRARMSARARRLLGLAAQKMTRREELEAIERHVAEHGVRRVTIDRLGNVRLRTVRA